MSEPTLILDFGHGGHDPGAVSYDGKYNEKDVVLKVGNLIYDMLSQYECKVYRTRDDDTFLSLSARANKANSLGADLISLHCNSGGGTGFEVFTSIGQTKSDPLATAIILAYDAEFPNLVGRYDVSDGDPDKEAKFTVLTSTRKSAVLVELGFIDKKDLAFLTSSSNQLRMAEAVTRGIVAHYGLKKKDSSVPTPPKPTPTPPESSDNSEVLTAVQAVQSALENLVKTLS